MNFKEELDKVLKQYRERHEEYVPDHVIFFREDEGDEVDHLFCHGPQIPAVSDYTKWYQPYMVVIRPIGPLAFAYDGSELQ